MPFGLDASVAASWAFEDEDRRVAALALERVRADEARAGARIYGGSTRATRGPRTNAIKAWRPQGIKGLRLLPSALSTQANFLPDTTRRSSQYGNEKRPAYTLVESLVAN